MGNVDKLSQTKSRESGERQAITDQASRENLSHYANSHAIREASERKSNNTASQFLPDLQITGAATPTDVQLTTEKVGDGKKVTIQALDGRTSSIEYNDDSQPIRYTSFDGETFNNIGKDQNDKTSDSKDVWKSESNKVQPAGIHLDISDKHDVNMIDLATGNEVAFTAGGVETTKFKEEGKITGKTIREFINGKEEITIECANLSVRKMVVENNKLESYTDSRGITYTKPESHPLTEQRLKKDGEKDPFSIQPVYEARDRDGNTIPGRFTIKSDRTGNVCVRNIDQSMSLAYAHRELANGTVIESDATNSVREVTTAGGLKVRTISTHDEKMNTNIINSKTITYPDEKGSIELTYSSTGELQHVEGSVNGESVDYTSGNGMLETISIEEKNAEVSITRSGYFQRDNVQIATDGSLQVKPGEPTTLAAPDLERAPIAIAKTPKGVNLQANIAEAQKNDVTYDVNPWGTREKWFLEQVNYGGVWDYKSPLTRPTEQQSTLNNQPINDQLYMAEYEDYGNWHFGVVGHAAGFSESVLMWKAGGAQVDAHTSKPEWGTPGVLPVLHTGTYGDDPHDNALIHDGYEAEEHLL